MESTVIFRHENQWTFLEWNFLPPGSHTGSPESAAGVGSPTWKHMKLGSFQLASNIPQSLFKLSWKQPTKNHQDCNQCRPCWCRASLFKVQSGKYCFKKHANGVLSIMNPILSTTEIIWVRFHLVQASCSSSESMACKPLLSPSNLIWVPWIQQKAWEDIRSHMCTKSCHPQSVAWSSKRFIIYQSMSTKGKAL